MPVSADPYDLPRFKREANDAWRQEANCLNTDIDAFYGGGGRSIEAADLCAECPVTWECFAFAAHNDIGFGVWGGMDTTERRTLLRTHAFALTPRVREEHARQMTELRRRTEKRRKR